MTRGGFPWQIESANSKRSLRRSHRILPENRGESRLNDESPPRAILQDHYARILRFLRLISISDNLSCNMLRSPALNFGVNFGRKYLIFSGDELAVFFGSDDGSS